MLQLCRRRLQQNSKLVKHSTQQTVVDVRTVAQFSRHLIARESTVFEQRLYNSLRLCRVCGCMNNMMIQAQRRPITSDPKRSLAI